MYHRGRARGSYRRHSLFISDDFGGAATFKSILIVQGRSSAGVAKLKSLWLKLQGYGTGGQEYATGWSSFYRGNAPPSQNVQFVSNPDFLDPKPYVWTAGSQQPWEHYLKGVNLTLGENLYFCVFTAHVGGSPSYLGGMKYVEEETIG